MFPGIVKEEKGEGFSFVLVKFDQSWELLCCESLGMKYHLSCWNVSHWQQPFSEIFSLRQSRSIPQVCYSWVEMIFKTFSWTRVKIAQSHVSEWQCDCALRFQNYQEQIIQLWNEFLPDLKFLVKQLLRKHCEVNFKVKTVWTVLWSFSSLNSKKLT